MLQIAGNRALRQKYKNKRNPHPTCKDTDQREHCLSFWFFSGVQNHEAAITNIERKERQCQVAKKRNAEQASQSAATGSSSAQADASSSNVPEPKAAPVPEPKTPPQQPSSRSAQAEAPQNRSWSWSGDHSGSRREWTRWHGEWYYRDNRQSRWIY